MSSTGTYTPGPWSVDRPYIRGAERVIATLEAGRNEVEDAANARLIAAAPELLECLRHIQGIISESQGVAGWHLNGEIAGWDELGLREEIDAVLAKVRGEVE